MTAPQRTCVLLSATVLAATASLKAQQVVTVPIVPPGQAPPAQVTSPAQPRPLIPVKIDVLLTRVKGTEKVASMPYSVWAVDGTRAMLRLGSSVPVPQAVVGGNPANPITSFSYQEVGVSIDVNVSPQPDGRYRLALVVEDTSLGEGMEAGTAKLPVIRRYRLDTQVIVRDGQLSEFNVASDKVTGETIRAQVTMTVLK
jgi:type II secretory pathway component GspD/PulD (secretin)